MNGQNLDLWMLLSKDPKYLIRKRLSYLFYVLEIEQDLRELVDPG